jgi:polysaccharide biosynthesis/export protein
MINKIQALLLSSALMLLILCSCNTQKNLNYFSSDKRDSSHSVIWQKYEAKIQPGDRLQVNVTALNPESAKPYMLSQNTASGATQQNTLPGNITVEPDGRILYPQLGFITAAGLTKRELRDTFLSRLKIYLNDPVVTVDILNMNITVLGEVNKQGPIPLTAESMTILQALGEAGDIASTGKRDSVLVIRETGGKRSFGHVNLLSNEVFKSPYFILQQNDVVYVPMNEKKVKTENEQVFIRNLSIVTSVLAVVSTLGLLILNLTR